MSKSKSQTETERVERELGSQVTACPSCGEGLSVQGTDDAGALVLETHDHDAPATADDAAAAAAETAEAEMPRETGTTVTTEES